MTVQGTDKADAMTLTGKVVVAGTATLTGLPATVNISHAEGALDTLAIDAGAGADTLDTSAFAPATIGLEVLDQSPASWLTTGRLPDSGSSSTGTNVNPSNRARYMSVGETPSW